MAGTVPAFETQSAEDYVSSRKKTDHCPGGRDRND